MFFFQPLFLFYIIAFVVVVYVGFYSVVVGPCDAKHLMSIEKSLIDDSANVAFMDQDLEVSPQFVVKSHSVVFLPLADNERHVIFIHGANSGPVLWFKSATILANKGFTVHCLALPGFGASHVDRSVLDLSCDEILEFNLQYILKYITSNKIVKPSLVGHSLGGFLAGKFNCKYPHICKNFVLVNSAGVLPVNGYDSFYWAILFKLGIPNCVGRFLSPIITPILFALIYMLNLKEKKYYWDIAQMTCIDSFGDQIVSKFVEFPQYNKCVWKCDMFGDLLSTTGLPPFSAIWGTDDTIIPVSIAHFLMPLFGSEVFTIDEWHVPVLKTKEFVKTLISAMNTATQQPVVNGEKREAIDKIISGFYASPNISRTRKDITKSYQVLKKTLNKPSFEKA